MELKSQQIVNADFLVLGGGAGLSAAIEARKHGVGVLQVFERVRKAVNDMVKDCQVTSGHFVQLGSQLLGSCSQVTIVRSVTCVQRNHTRIRTEYNYKIGIEGAFHDHVGD